ncbi:MAG: imidazole glycerol phosphate synthase subunit HisH [Planctomycetes bacterium]|nr:imidazole glycerol phosphate synthase subunit HisH [Planctomycetota bacterium]
MITIVDYGMGNLRSVQKGFERVGHEARISSDPNVVAAADKLVLPGVGAFGDAMIELRSRGLVEPVRDYIRAGRPTLGICLGLQLLFDVGYEDGAHQGLGILPGEVVKFQLPHDYKVPHMGWNQLQIVRRPPLLADIADGAHMYFVHSYYVVPRDAEVIATQTEYGPPFTSMIWRDRLYATQFHPEKSQAEGLKILKNFAERG